MISFDIIEEIIVFFLTFIFFFLFFLIKIIFSIKGNGVIELLFNFDFDLRRLKIRIFSKFLFFVDDEFRMKFVFLIHCFFFFVIFFKDINMMIRIFLIESTNNKGGVLKTFETRERIICSFEMLIFVILIKISNIENE